MQPLNVIIEGCDGDGAIRIPAAMLQELGINVGDTLYLHTTPDGFVMSTRRKPHYRLEDLLAQCSPTQKQSGAIAQPTPLVSQEAMSPTDRKR